MTSRAHRSNAPSRRPAGVAVALAAVVLSAQAVAAQGLSEPGRAFASVSAGILQPSDDLVGDLYGRSVAVSIQVDWRVWRSVAVFGGARVQRASGATRVVDPLFDESYPLTLRTTGLRAGALLQFARWQWEFAVGGGPTWVRYDERWPAAGVTAKGSRAGVLLQAGAARTIRGPLAAVVRVEYDSVAVRRGDAGEGRVNLGGLAAGAGLGLRF